MTKLVDRWKDVKLTAIGRQAIREAIRRHPQATAHVESSSQISQLKKSALLDLATKLGVDVAEKLKVTDYDFSDLNHFPFNGVVEFDLTFGLLGKQVTRKARVNYEHSPAWAYFDEASGGERLGTEGYSFALEVQAVHEPTTTMSTTVRGRTVYKHFPTTWEKCDDLTELGVLSEEMMDEVFALIDRDCRAIDQARRDSAKA